MTQARRVPTPVKFGLLTLFLSTLVLSTATAQVSVIGTSNIFGAGHETAPGPGGAGGGTLPPVIAIPPGTGRTVTLALSGTIDYGGCCPTTGPDGSSFTGLVPEPQYDGLAGCDLDTRARYLAAVFLDDNEPMDPAPDSLVIPDIFFSELSPELRQIFFVGDGLTGEGTGTTQVFNIPDGATRMFFGYQDRCSTSPNVPGWYGDNSGTVTGTVSFGGVTGIGDPVLTAYQLLQNSPNPFRASTSISFSANSDGFYGLRVFDVRGRLVRVLLESESTSGTMVNLTWDGRNMDEIRVPSGVYYYRLQTPTTITTRKMLLLR